MNRIAFCVLAFCAPLLLSCSQEPETAAPIADFETRRKWGERHFGGFLPIAEKWVKNSQAIRNSVGEVQRIAPIGSPNERFFGFTDGNAMMQLEVIGSKGDGILFLPSISAIAHDSCIGLFEAKWTAGDRQQIIELSGQDLLSEFELEAAYNQLINYSADQDADRFLFDWDQFQQNIERTFPRHQSPVRRVPMQGLHAIYRDPLLQHKANLLCSWELNDTAAETLRVLAVNAMDRVRDGLREKKRNEKRVTSDLKFANDSLCKANELVPDCLATIRLARRRIALHHCVRMGSANLDPKKCHDIFFEAAVREAKQLKYLRRNLGEIQATRDSRFSEEGIYVNNKNRYAAYVHLELNGDKGRGRLEFRFRENEEKLPPLDLFAEQPRFPDYPLKFRSPRWESSEGEKVKLSAKTGEPLEKTHSD